MPLGGESAWEFTAGYGGVFRDSQVHTHSVMIGIARGGELKPLSIKFLDLPPFPRAKVAV